jgi:tetratricopeptide (TPR) repeat protein
MRGDLAEARADLERALASAGNREGVSDGLHALLRDLADVARAQGDLSGAIAFLQHRIALRRLRPPEATQAEDHRMLARLFRQQGDAVRETAEWENVVRIDQAFHGPAHLLSVKDELALARLYLAAGERGRAAELGRSALAALDARFGSDSPQAMQARRIVERAGD